jgi:hypothetical protein
VRNHTKIARVKWTGGVAQVVSDCFASMDPWVQNPVPPKKKKKKDKKNQISNSTIKLILVKPLPIKLILVKPLP